MLGNFPVYTEINSCSPTKSKSTLKSSNIFNTPDNSLVFDNSSFKVSFSSINLVTMCSNPLNSFSISSNLISSTLIFSPFSSSGALNSISFRLFFAPSAGRNRAIRLSILARSSELFINTASAFEGSISPSQSPKNSFISARWTEPKASILLITPST